MVPHTMNVVRKSNFTTVILTLKDSLREGAVEERADCDPLGLAHVLSEAYLERLRRIFKGLWGILRHCAFNI